MLVTSVTASWKRYMPAPPRTTVLPLPNTSQAKPARGSTYSGAALTPEFGTDEFSPCHVNPGSGFVVGFFAVVYRVGFHIDAPTPCASSHGPSWLTRRPTVTTTLGVARHV